jgi:hypothetical protein
MPIRLVDRTGYTARPVERETEVTVSGHKVIVRLELGGKLLKFRRKGLRTEGWVTLSIESAFWAAARATYGGETKARQKVRGGKS